MPHLGFRVRRQQSGHGKNHRGASQTSNRPAFSNEAGANCGSGRVAEISGGSRFPCETAAKYF
jgi:hypothetical protein